MSNAAIRPETVSMVAAGSGDNVGNFSGASGIGRRSTPGINLSDPTLINASRDIVYNATDNTDLTLQNFRQPRDLSFHRANNWFSPWMGYLNNSPPGYVSPYYLQEHTGLGLAYRNGPNFAGNYGPRCGQFFNRPHSRDVYPGYYYRGYNDYNSDGGYFGYPSCGCSRFGC